MNRTEIFVAGGTGYIGRALIPALASRGHRVRALARPASIRKVPRGAATLAGDPFDARTFAGALSSGTTFVQLVGVPHPSPSKAAQFIDVDLRSARTSIAAAREAGVAHFVYVSVAQPAPVMRAYQDARRQAEKLLAASGLRHTILRPWYVLGPGHRWPYALVPLYWCLERLGATRESAARLGLVTLNRMVEALACAIEQPPSGMSRLLEVPEIRLAHTRTMTAEAACPVA